MKTKKAGGSRMRDCQHCGRWRFCRARGLCWRCSQSPAVRELYPSTDKRVRLGEGTRNSASPLPTPILFPQTRAERIAALEERVRRGEALKHPADAPLATIQDVREVA